VFYRLMPDNLANALHGYAQEVCPVSRPLKAESAAIASTRSQGKADSKI
jgi:ArsR family transcriptional regulator, arsenate/arsenite/antimonite-responsive transcriptional repressor